jgi:uncharacterized membrane protein
MAGIAAVSPRVPSKLLAGAELVADKLPSAPNRVAPALLLGRIAAGAFVGAAVGRRTGMGRGEAALIGGLIAFASTHVTYRMRRSLARRLSPQVAALVEDAVVLGTAAAGAALLRSERRGRRLPSIDETATPFSRW